METKNHITVFLCKTDDIQDESLTLLKQQLPKAQQVQLSKFKSKKRKKEFILGRSLLISAIKHYNPKLFPNLNIKEVDGKAPSIEGIEKLHLSISHSYDFVCCTLHHSPIGIDIERKKNRKVWFETAQFFMDREESEQLNKLLLEDKKDYFYKTWCIKEAAFKALSIEEQEKLNLHSISSIHSFDNDWSLYETTIESYQLAVAYFGPFCKVNIISKSFSL